MTKELKDKFRQAQALRWGKDQKMIDYCCKKADIVYPVRGYVAEIEKPSIETSFCYSYGYCGVSTEEDYLDAARMADHARTNEDYFIAKNLHGLNEYIEALGNDNYTAYMTGNNELVQLHFCKQWEAEQQKRWAENGNYTFIELSQGERKEIAGYYGIEKDRFAKRLKTYLKRYGMSKVQSWTYLSD